MRDCGRMMSGALLAAAGTTNARFCLLYYVVAYQVSVSSGFAKFLAPGMIAYLLVALNNPVSVAKHVVVEVLETCDSALPIAHNGDVLWVCGLPCVIEDEETNKDDKEGAEDAPRRQRLSDLGVKTARHGDVVYSRELSFSEHRRL